MVKLGYLLYIFSFKSKESKKEKIIGCCERSKDHKDNAHAPSPVNLTLPFLSSPVIQYSSLHFLFSFFFEAGGPLLGGTGCNQETN